MSSIATLVALIYICVKYSTCTMIRQYHFDITPRTWSEAKAFCHESPYQGLATILTADEFNNAMFTIPQMVGSPIAHIWMGLTDLDEEGVWEWEDGTKCSENATTGGHDCSDFWYNHEPNDANNDEDCGALLYRDGRWTFNDDGCSNKFAALCNKPFEYTYHWNGTFMNWTDAQIYCKTKHGGMATIQTSDDYINAIKVIGTGVDQVWIGLNDMNNESVWEWSNGDKCISNNNISHDCAVFWGEGQPDDWRTGEDCGQMWKTGDCDSRTWVFNDIDCNETSTVLCVESNTVHPTPQPHQDIHGGRFVFSSTDRTWADSLVYCEENYYGMASILNQTDLLEATQLIPNNVDVMDTLYVWIGINDLKIEGVWEWSDGAQCSANNNNCTDLWNKGEPNNWKDENEDCGELRYITDSKEWKVNDKPCDYIRPVLCSMNETTPNPTYGATLVPSNIPTIKPSNIPTIKPSMLPTMISSILPTNTPISSMDDKSSNSSSSVSTLDIILILIIVLLIIGLGSTIFCLLKFKKMHKRVEEMSNYVGQQDTTKDLQLITNDD